MIIVWGSIETTADNLEMVLSLSLEHVRRSRQEVGCISHDAHIHLEKPHCVVFYEQWQDMATLRDHFAVPESAQFVAAVTELATTVPEIRIFDARPITGGMS
ncbi:MAG: putative quinol monooxygenase [Xanthomonadales bacterium]|nr:putative quinol monooxygenase [Xanthomonadales bacterium]